MRHEPEPGKMQLHGRKVDVHGGSFLLLALSTQLLAEFDPTTGLDALAREIFDGTVLDVLHDVVEQLLSTLMETIVRQDVTSAPDVERTSLTAYLASRTLLLERCFKRVGKMHLQRLGDGFLLGAELGGQLLRDLLGLLLLAV